MLDYEVNRVLTVEGLVFLGIVRHFAYCILFDFVCHSRGIPISPPLRATTVCGIVRHGGLCMLAFCKFELELSFWTSPGCRCLFFRCSRGAVRRYRDRFPFLLDSQRLPDGWRKHYGPDFRSNCFKYESGTNLSVSFALAGGGQRRPTFQTWSWLQFERDIYDEIHICVVWWLAVVVFSRITTMKCSSFNLGTEGAVPQLPSVCSAAGQSEGCWAQ